MKHNVGMGRAVLMAGVVCGVAVFTAPLARAHCDTMNGPVIPEARGALEQGDVTPVLKWVTPGNEAEIKSAFAKAVVVRAKGPEAKALADQYFLETLVRLHRAGEGAPYTGIRDEPVEPIVALADKALRERSADDLIQALAAHLRLAVQEKFSRVMAAAKHKDENPAAGRAYVAAYVTYTHYVEALHAAIVSAGGHEHAGGDGRVTTEGETTDHGH